MVAPPLTLRVENVIIRPVHLWETGNDLYLVCGPEIEKLAAAHASDMVE